MMGPQSESYWAGSRLSRSISSGHHRREIIAYDDDPNLDEIKVERIVTACSNCRNMLEDGLDENHMDIEVVGLTEMLAEHLVSSQTTTSTGDSK